MSRGSVLVVDDDSAIRQVLRDALSLLGFEVEAAENGSAALRVLQGPWRPDAILLDLMMPVMDGYQFLAAWQRDPRSGAVPVIVSSAGPARQPLNVAAVLPKPVDLDALERTLERVVQPG